MSLHASLDSWRLLETPRDALGCHATLRDAWLVCLAARAAPAFEGVTRAPFEGFGDSFCGPRDGLEHFAAASRRTVDVGKEGSRAIVPFIQMHKA